MIRTGIIIMSLVAAAGICVLWVWSYTGRYKQPGWTGTITGWEITSQSGDACVSGSRGMCYVSLHANVIGRTTWVDSKFTVDEWFGPFQLLATQRFVDFWFPVWSPLVLMLAFPTIALVHGSVRRWRRRRRGLCTSCGYDLYGNTSEKCPECGTGIESKRVTTLSSGRS